jgi:hypothetical protein
MKARKSRISSDSNGDSAFYVDLNEPGSQEKIVQYIRFGVPASDSKHGHHVRLQCKVTPVQADILASLREKAPKGYWKNQSDLMRSLVALGAFVTLKFLNNSENIKDLKKEFKLLDLINLVERNTREAELTVETRKAIYNINTQPYDIDSAIQDLVAEMQRKKKATG